MWQIYVWAIVAGAMLGVGSVWSPGWVLSLFSFSVLLHVLYRCEQVRFGFQVGLVTATTAYGITFYGMFWDTLPLDWLGLGGIPAIALIACLWLVTTLVFAVAFAIAMGIAVRYFRHRPYDVFLLAALYVLADTLGAVLFSIIHAGSTSLFGPHFTMGSPGYLLADSPLLRQVAALAGLYGLLFIQAFIGAGSYWLWRSAVLHRQWWIAATVSVVTLCIAYAPLPERQEATGEYLSIAAVTAYKRSSVTAYHAEITEELVTIASTTDLVILPEESRYIQYADQTARQTITDSLPYSTIIDSGTIMTEQGMFPQIMAYTGAQGIYATSSKQFLMVFGEYMPFIYQWLAPLIGQSAVVERLKKEHGYQTDTSRLFEVKSVLVSTYLCSDAMSPTLYAAAALDGAEVLVNLSAHGWFHRSPRVYEAALRIGQIRATENNRWYVRAAYETPSFVIDARGRIIAQTAWGVVTPLFSNVQIISTHTLYSRLGLHVLGLPFMIVMLWIIRSERARLRPGRNGFNRKE